MDLLLAASSSDSPNIMLIVMLAVGGGLLLFAGIYGAIRGFYRLTWIGFELLIAFCLELLIPPQENLAVSVLLLLAFTALPLTGEYFLRRALFTGRVLGQSRGEKIFNHIFGAVTAIVGVLAFALSVGGLGIAVADVFTEGGLSLPAFVADHALDFFLIAVCLVTMRAGCRLGVMKGLNMLLAAALTFGAFFGFFLLFSQVEGGIGFSGSVGGWFGLHGTAAAFLGCFVLTFFFSAVTFVGIMFLSKFLDGMIGRANSHIAVAIPDAIVPGILFTVAFIFVILGIQAVFGVLARGDLLTSLLGSAGDFAGIDGSIAEVGGKLTAFATSSPISAGFYFGNPFLG